MQMAEQYIISYFHVLVFIYFYYILLYLPNLKFQKMPKFEKENKENLKVCIIPITCYEVQRQT